MAQKTSSKRPVGRPVLFKGNLKKHVVGVARRFGNLTHARLALLAEKPPVNISMPTLRKYTREAGVEVPMGRPAKAA
jgi:hypothetical protein